MSVDAKIALKGYVPPERVLAWVKQNFDPNATSEVAFEELKKPNFQVYEYYRPDKKWVIQSGFINFIFKGEGRRLFYYYSSINTHENEELYKQAGLMDMVIAEKTFLILGHWGVCDQIMRGLITCAGGAWYDENDCDDKEYEWFTVEKAQEKR